MLSDFLTLEIYFGHENAALYCEDLAKRYGREQVKSALRDGDLQCRPVCGGVLAWLTLQGRQRAENGLV